ncbi:MAG: RnfABCDGE type electron transport complex subunit D [SAR324 cluster bacterium]|nr:RnfABCDGE type electron transport complex subunit D [SAR324 cluster bacterium]MBL7034529.1 RnfABCDGE type electron transport complex subunit D [SAR324 cluster bacterium]
MKKELILSTSPFLHDSATTPWIMFQVIYALIPIIAAAAYFFGMSALLLIAVTVLACLVTERIFTAAKQEEPSSLKDGSAVLTGILLALTLPPGFPLWMAFLGGLAAIGMGKMIWGGLGQNIFNPALLGRAFLQSSFPTAITTWSVPDGQFFSFRGTNLALPFFQGESLDSATSATPLALMKFQQEGTEWFKLLMGNTSGSLGETSAALLLLVGVYLGMRRVFDWRIPVSIILTVTVLSSIFYVINAERFPSPDFMLLSGGLLLGAIFMATDPVTSPYTPKGVWYFGFGIGFLVVLIRLFGGLPEGVMYAVLLMNSVTPLLNKLTRKRVYGHLKNG